jgi:hypothetical protein
MKTVLFSWPTHAGSATPRRRSRFPLSIFRDVFSRGRPRDLARGTLRRNAVVPSGRTQSGSRQHAH